MAHKQPKKNCLRCKFLVQQDTGYSNYTVEGTDVYCGVDKHPESKPTELPYDTNDDWLYGQAALQCEWFFEGLPLAHIDVEGDDVQALRVAKHLSIIGGLTLQHAQAYVLGLWEPDEEEEKKGESPDL